MTNISEKQKLCLLNIDINQLINTILLYYLVGMLCSDDKLNIMLQEISKSIIDTLSANGLDKKEVEKVTIDVISNVKRTITTLRHGEQRNEQCK